MLLTIFLIVINLISNNGIEVDLEDTSDIDHLPLDRSMIHAYAERCHRIEEEYNGRLRSMPNDDLQHIIKTNKLISKYRRLQKRPALDVDTIDGLLSLMEFVTYDGLIDTRHADITYNERRILQLMLDESTSTSTALTTTTTESLENESCDLCSSNTCGNYSDINERLILELILDIYNSSRCND